MLTNASCTAAKEQLFCQLWPKSQGVTQATRFECLMACDSGSSALAAERSADDLNLVALSIADDGVHDVEQILHQAIERMSEQGLAIPAGISDDTKLKVCAAYLKAQDPNLCKLCMDEEKRERALMEQIAEKLWKRLRGPVKLKLRKLNCRSLRSSPT